LALALLLLASRWH
jgi:fumarate reductase subunit D